MVPNTQQKRKKQKKLHVQDTQTDTLQMKDGVTLMQESSVSQEKGLYKKRYTMRNIFLGAAVFGIVCFGVGISSFFVSFNRILASVGLTQTEFVSLVQKAHTQSKEDTYVLILGKGGGSHESPDLTDTIQLVQVNKTEKRVNILSLPRDIWSDTLRDKINSAYYYGKEQKRTEGGMGFAKEIIQEITGVPIDDVVVVDFSTFVELITILGGVPVEVSIPFTDTEYPIAGKENDMCGGDTELRCRYTTVTFSKGVEIMNGERALTYVRSRHAHGDEGTDFSRGRRQQEVIKGIVERLKTPWEWMEKDTPKKLYDVVTQNIETTLTIEKLVFLAVSFLDSQGAFSVYSFSLEPLLKNPSPAKYGGRYVLIPTTSYADFRQSIQASFSSAIQ